METSLSDLETALWFEDYMQSGEYAARIGRWLDRNYGDWQKVPESELEAIFVLASQELRNAR